MEVKYVTLEKIAVMAPLELLLAPDGTLCRFVFDSTFDCVCIVLHVESATKTPILHGILSPLLRSTLRSHLCDIWIAATVQAFCSAKL